uniref:outer membrane beta-barrel protein n=1 Tax=uncultured Draconibacterium sp. TaxID=1573823 RepID=UPI003216A598
MNIEKPLKTKLPGWGATLCFIFIIAFFQISFAQETDTIVPVQKDPEKILRRVDISKITRNGLTPWKTKFSGHYAGIDFGFNMFLNKDYSGYDSEFLENDVLRSNSAYFNVVQQSIGLQKNRNTFGLVSGLGLHLQSYRLDDNTTVYLDESNVVQPEYLFFNDNQKSKLAIVSLTVPLLVEWQIPINHYDNRIYFSAGVLGSLRIGSHTKIKYKTEQKEKLKVEDHFSIHRFKYSVMGRTGYRWFNVFVSYDLVPLFKDSKGPELIPFTVGVTLMRF